MLKHTVRNLVLPVTTLVALGAPALAQELVVQPHAANTTSIEPPIAEFPGVDGSTAEGSIDYDLVGCKIVGTAGATIAGGDRTKVSVASEAPIARCGLRVSFNECEAGQSATFEVVSEQEVYVAVDVVGVIPVFDVVIRGGTSALGVATEFDVRAARPVNGMTDNIWTTDASGGGWLSTGYETKLPAVTTASHIAQWVYAPSAR